MFRTARDYGFRTRRFAALRNDINKMELSPGRDVSRSRLERRGNTMLSTILIVILILLLIGALPAWPYSTGWGYYPGGGLGLILIIVIVLALAGRI
jgi:hypothetical protein